MSSSWFRFLNVVQCSTKAVSLWRDVLCLRTGLASTYTAVQIWVLPQAMKNSSVDLIDWIDQGPKSGAYKSLPSDMWGILETFQRWIWGWKYNTGPLRDQCLSGVTSGGQTGHLQKYLKLHLHGDKWAGS